LPGLGCHSPMGEVLDLTATDYRFHDLRCEFRLCCRSRCKLPMAVAALQAEFTAAVFKLEAGRQGLLDLDRYIAEAEAAIASKPDIREVEAEGAERR
jgi:hypothetical protein